MKSDKKHLLLLLVAGLSCLLVLHVSFCYYATKRQQKDGFIDANEGIPIRFMDKMETHKFLSNDEDGYIKGMSDITLQQRWVGNGREAYKDRASRSASSFVPYEKETLTVAAKMVDAYIAQRQRRAASEKQGKLLPPWTFALTSGNDYEYGMPHVRGKDLSVYFFSEDYLADLLQDSCQLRWTLWYMRMQTLYPLNDKACPTIYKPGNTPLLLGKTKLPQWAFPESYPDPFCGSPGTLLQ